MRIFQNFSLRELTTPCPRHQSYLKILIVDLRSLSHYQYLVLMPPSYYTALDCHFWYDFYDGSMLPVRNKVMRFMRELWLRACKSHGQSKIWSDDKLSLLRIVKLVVMMRAVLCKNFPGPSFFRPEMRHRPSSSPAWELGNNILRRKPSAAQLITADIKYLLTWFITVT